MLYPWMLSAGPHYGPAATDPVARVILFVASRGAGPLGALREMLAGYSPLVEQFGAAGFYLDLSATAWTGGAEALAERIGSRAQGELRLPVAIGIGPNKSAARLLAVRLRPGQVRRIAPGEVAGFMAGLPLGALPGLLPDDDFHLGELGIGTIGQVAAMPLALLTVLCGARAAELHRVANGCDLRPVTATPATEPLGRATIFEPTLNRESLDFRLRQLSVELAATLRDWGKGVRLVRLTVEFSSSRIERQRRLAESVSSSAALFDHAEALLHTALLARRQRVRGISLSVERLTDAATQLRIFGSSSEVLRYQRLNLSLESLREQYGAAAIQPANLWAQSYAAQILNWPYRQPRTAPRIVPTILGLTSAVVVAPASFAYAAGV